MTRRGSYAKGLAKREEILTTALELVARNGYRRTTVRELADAVGLSQAGLMHHFGSKEELFTEILRRRDEADRAEFLGDPETTDLPDAYVRLVRHNAGVPGLVRLYNRVSAEAVEPEHPSHEYFGERYRALRADTAGAIRRLQAEGRMPAAADPDKLAVLVTALLDGLQTAWLYDGGTDMAEHVAHFWELVRGE